ncbi:hypothetical protein QA601_18385 [Chitinispirillales bacterium ANBcel5]|uniref:hypothetical protein n=1 Tax=Cellulosispirillum alkaliphilum TaxID=3039283 RepID=UPI002A58FAA5|nr:hypothetical protein [Chitinispirillales bacterium ANBcel5]
MLKIANCSLVWGNYTVFFWSDPKPSCDTRTGANVVSTSPLVLVSCGEGVIFLNVKVFIDPGDKPHSFS